MPLNLIPILADKLLDDAFGRFPSALRSRMVGRVTPHDPRLLPRVLSDADYPTASIGTLHLVPQGLSMHAALAAEAPQPSHAAMTKYDDNSVPIRARTLTALDWKATLHAGSNDGELYDRRQAPGELHYLWHSPARQLNRDSLLVDLVEHLICTVDGREGRVQGLPVPIAKHQPKQTISRVPPC